MVRGKGIKILAHFLAVAETESECAIKTKGGKTMVSFNHIDGDNFEGIKLIGPAKMVFSGVIDV